MSPSSPLGVLVGSAPAGGTGTPVGPAPPVPRTVTVVLNPLMSQSEIAQRLADLAMQLPRERQYLTDPEFTQLCGADPGAVETVKSFAASNGLQVEFADVTRRSVVLTGSLAAIQSAFKVTLQQFSGPVVMPGVVMPGAVPPQQYVSHTGPVSLPAPLIPIVETVLGLDDQPPVHDIVMPPEPGMVFVSPGDVAQRYNFPAGRASGQKIGIILPGCGLEMTAVQQHFVENGLPAPNVNLQTVFNGVNRPCTQQDVATVLAILSGKKLATGQPGNFAAGMNTIESNMDAILAASFAPGATVVVYAAPNDDQGGFHALSQASTDPDGPSVISCSWSRHENLYSPSVIQAYTTVFQLAALRGVTICFSSGDDGDGTLWGQSTTPVVHYPSSSPYVLACGGTSLLAPVPTFTEVSWNEQAGQMTMASGGGYSASQPQPAWQTGKCPQAQGRGVPDVSGKADVNGGYQMKASGIVFTMGGTSASAPMWAAMAALMNQTLGVNVGFFAPLLYTDAFSAVCRQMTASNNGKYQVTPGWNPVTGWGSPNCAAILSALGG